MSNSATVKIELYHLIINGKKQGPYSEGEVLVFLREATITKDTLIWTEGMADWQPVASVETFKSLSVAPPPVPGSIKTESQEPTSPGSSNNEWAKRAEISKNQELVSALKVFIFVAILFLGGISAYKIINDPDRIAQMEKEEKATALADKRSKCKQLTSSYRIDHDLLFSSSGVGAIGTAMEAKERMGELTRQYARLECGRDILYGD